MGKLSFASLGRCVLCKRSQTCLQGREGFGGGRLQPNRQVQLEKVKVTGSLIVITRVPDLSLCAQTLLSV